VRHSLILERGSELHLFEGVPAKWARPGAVTIVRDIATEFGPISFEFRVARNGASGILKLTPRQRTPPSRIVLHLDHWSGQTGTLDLPVRGVRRNEVKLIR
jgi:hypothetical protein